MPSVRIRSAGAAGMVPVTPRSLDVVLKLIAGAVVSSEVSSRRGRACFLDSHLLLSRFRYSREIGLQFFSCGLEASFISSLLGGLLHMSAHNKVAGFPQRKKEEKEKKGKRGCPMQTVFIL